MIIPKHNLEAVNRKYNVASIMLSGAVGYYLSPISGSCLQRTHGCADSYHRRKLEKRDDSKASS